MDINYYSQDISLAQGESGKKYTVMALKGDKRFVSRITSVGLTIGAVLIVLQNVRQLPLLIYSRDTKLAIDRGEANNILVETNLE